MGTMVWSCGIWAKPPPAISSLCGFRTVPAASVLTELSPNGPGKVVEDREPGTLWETQKKLSVSVLVPAQHRVLGSVGK